MNPDMLTGEKVRLTAEDPKTLAELYARWSSDSEYWRLQTTGVPRQYSVKATEKDIEEFLQKEHPDLFFFNIRTLDGNQLIGDIGLDGIHWNHGESFVGISIGDRAYWGQGYGTDAMRVILHFGFQELNLRRVSLDVFEYNPRAIRSYEKAGFRHEGRMRGYLNRDGQRWDLIFMGILRSEWQGWAGGSVGSQRTG